MNRVNMISDNQYSKNIDMIEKMFPSCITESCTKNGYIKKSINFDMLKQLLSNNISEGNETYEFTWVGKKASIVEANEATINTLRPYKKESVNWDNTENLYIEGDNLDVLKILQESYYQKVKIIYIDPPYNTGKDFVYRDNYTATKNAYEYQIGSSDEEGHRFF